MVVPLIRKVDKLLGSTICTLFGSLKRKKTTFKTDTILVIQLWGIGETILTLPAIKALKDRYPKSKITVLATLRNQEVFTGLSYIDHLEILPLNILKIELYSTLNIGKYDLVIDMEEYLNISAILAFKLGKFAVGYNHGARSKCYNRTVKYNDMQHCSETFADLVRAIDTKVTIPNLLPLHIPKTDKESINTLIKREKITSSAIAIAPGLAETSKERMWPQDRYAQLADGLAKQGNQILFVGVESEKPLIKNIQSQMKEKSINLAGKTSIKQLAYLFTKCKSMVGNDSGPMHIAACMGTKTVGLFGPNLPIRFQPLGDDNIGLYKATCPCSPTINVHKGEFKPCNNNNNLCMQSIKVEDVLKALN
ncbi:MAG: glycosyltransferase family 9 protein [Nanoarchaeota archaeon]|nr:glycosyltransferase family 9 protein [Nanoarchaeota archaeon]